jgi:C4-type Zn-finger protein
MLVKIKCPVCQTEGTLSLVESSYEGPYRCWRCRALFTIRLNDNELTSCEPLSEEDLHKQQQEKAIQDKLKRQFPGRQGTD